jgi:hypothetical protein
MSSEGGEELQELPEIHRVGKMRGKRDMIKLLR